jgi:NTP pyrophosphatase (non-canonical NTP hydrolase)
MSYVLDEIATERNRQDAKFGAQNHSPADWIVILGEEYGEVCRAICESRFAMKRADDARKEEAYDGASYHQADYMSFLHSAREELVQVAAVAVAMIESLDRNELGRKRD